MLTKREVTFIAWAEDYVPIQCQITVPAGTRAKQIVDNLGRRYWVVDDVALLMRLTGNTHDPKYRYVEVPDSAMEGED